MARNLKDWMPSIADIACLSPFLRRPVLTDETIRSIPAVLFFIIHLPMYMNPRFVFTCLVVKLMTISLFAGVKLPHLFQDGAVLQRGSETQIWGSAEPGEQIQIDFMGKVYQTRSSDNGEWKIAFDTLEAGGPFEMKIATDQGYEIVLKDLYIGDVWVCSGQSNMELPMERVKYRFPEIIARSQNATIRQFEVPDRYDFKAPRSDFESGSWVAADPESVLKFTAVGYFFAKAVQSSEGVPIGLINSALGGSPIQSWMSEDALQSFPSDLAEGKRWRDDELIRQTEAEDTDKSKSWYTELFERDSGVQGNEYTWANPETDTSDWVSVSLPGDLTQNGIESGPGVIWLKKEIQLTEDQASSSAQLWLGRIIDADKVFINGHFVGEVTYQYPPRIYDLPSGVLKAGINTLVVRVVVNGYRGQFVPDKPYFLKVGNEKIAVDGDWVAKQIRMDRPTPGTTFIRWKPMGLFNAMIAPMTSFAIKGVIWYQGESNTSNPANYLEMTEAMVQDWRKKWTGENEFPFIFVQLANLGEADVQPGNNNWSVVREAQSAATRLLPNTGIAIIYDVGEWNDIHPLDKQTVGNRLALCAEVLAYGHSDVVYKGPEFAGFEIESGQIRIRFRNVEGGLVTPGTEPLGGFAIAGIDGVYYWATATIDGDTVLVSSPEVSEPVNVRYAWSMNPDTANLYNGAGLPADPFRTDR